MKYRRMSMGGLGALPVNVDAIAAPTVGLVTSIGTAALLARYGSAGSFFTRHAGLVGIGAGAVSAGLYGLARGAGAGLAVALVAVAAGAAIEVFQYVVTKRLTAAMTTPPAITGMRGGTGYIRAKMLKGLGEAMRKGYRMQGGTALLDGGATQGVVF
jgi:hypothetical protein